MSDVTADLLRKIKGIEDRYSRTEVLETPEGGGRSILTANRTYYVRKDGSDSNNGLADTAAGAFLTIQKAIDVAAALDTSIYSITIQVRVGTYTEDLVLKQQSGAGTVTITGDTTTPSNVHISGTSIAILADGVRRWAYQGVKISSAGSYAVLLTRGAQVNQSGNCEIGATTFAHYGVFSLSSLALQASYTITGASTRHYYSEQSSITISSITVTLSGIQAYSIFAQMAFAGVIVAAGVTYTGGTITGQRYNVASNGVINTSGGGANYFPGDIAGATSTGGQYL